MINEKDFTNADLNGSSQLVYNHGLNTTKIIPALYDNGSIQTVTADLFWLGDANHLNQNNYVTVNLGSLITGTWKLLLEYQSTAESTGGRRAFELGTSDTLADDMRFLVGKAATPSVNITAVKMVAWLMTKLGFLKVASNLSDIADGATARNNLGVYSKTQIDAFLADYAELYQADSGKALGTENTGVYTPTSNYHPATKLYSDVHGGNILLRGSTTTFDMPGTDNKIDITFASVGTTNYMVILNLQDMTSGSPSTGYQGEAIVTRLHTATSFQVLMKEFTGVVQSFKLNWIIIAL